MAKAKEHCTLCGAPVRLENSGTRIPTHGYGGGALQCPASGGAFRSPADQEAERAAATAEEARKYERMRSEELARSTAITERPAWVPRWTVPEAPAVTLPAIGRIGYWLPRSSHIAHDMFIDRYISGRARPDWDDTNKHWAVNSAHFMILTGALVDRNRRVLLGREYNRNERCNHRCRGAEGYKCTCSCRARNHGNGRWMAHWQITDEMTNRIGQRHWSWTIIEKHRTS